MPKLICRFAILQIVLSVFVLFTLKAQTIKLEKETDSAARLAIHYLNTGLPDSVYLMAGDKFKKNINSNAWASAYKQIAALLPFTQVSFISSADSINKYKLEAKIPLNYYVSLDKAGKLNNFSFVPYQPEVRQLAMTETERKTDTLARRILLLINHKQADSIYLFAGNSFKDKIDAAKWKSIAENGLFPLTPLPEATFSGSKNGVNLYKMLPYQFILGLDEQGKYNVLALQPYKNNDVKDDKASTDNNLKTSLDSAVNQVLSAYIQTKGNVGLSTGVYYRGKEYFYNYGEIKAGSKQLPTNHTIYDIGSITKTFTATLLAKAVIDGKVTLLTPITKLLPDSVATNTDLKGITLGQLANHTSGLPRLPDNFAARATDPHQPYLNYSVSDMFAYLKHFKLKQAAGKSYGYSNLGAGLLGVLIERIYQRPYQNLVEQYIIKPLKLNETKFTVNTTDVIAQGYNEQNQPVAPWGFLAMKSAGAIKSSAFDLLAYSKVQLLLSKQPLNTAIKLTHQLTFNDGTNIVGLGWHFLADDKSILEHSGGTGGYRSMICVDADNQLTVVVLTNNATTGDALRIELMQRLRKLKK